MSETGPSQGEKGPSSVRDPHHPVTARQMGQQTAQRFSSRSPQTPLTSAGHHSLVKNGRPAELVSPPRAASSASGDHGPAHLAPLEVDAAGAPDPLTIGRRLRHLRKAGGKTLTDVAAAADISPSALS